LSGVSETTRELLEHGVAERLGIGMCVDREDVHDGPRLARMVQLGEMGTSRRDPTHYRALTGRRLRAIRLIRGKCRFSTPTPARGLAARSSFGDPVVHRHWHG
jgi:hypothetical protein